MVEFTPKQMVSILRDCADCNCTEACPYATVEHDCSAQLLRDAAELLEQACSET